MISRSTMLSLKNSLRIPRSAEYPAKWLLSSGGTLTGAVTFQDVVVDGDVHVKDNRVNGIDMNNVLTKNETELTIAGEKRFRQIFVRKETTAPLVNGVFA